MYTEQLKLIIAEGESLTVEFKEKYTPKIDRDIVAFSNTKGGRIILGVSDDGKTTGETLTNRLKAEILDLARKCEPSVEIKKITRCENLVVIEIPEGGEKPYSCSAGYFVRFDGLSQKMTQKEVRLVYKAAAANVFEEEFHRDFSWADVSGAKINAFFKEANIALGSASPQDALRSLGLAGKDGVKNAGVMFFAKEPRRHILQCQMTLAAFKGTNRVHIYDRKDIQDDLLTQYKEAVVFLEKHLNIRTEITGFDRKDIYEIPLEALREAVANAIVHRDYSMRGTSLMVEVHEDRVVISNPGGFPAGMSEQKLGALSVRRNELVADIFARMNRAERMGSGFKRIREQLAAAGLPFPEIESDSFFIIAFKRPGVPRSTPRKTTQKGSQTGSQTGSQKSSQKGSQKSSQKILEMLASRNEITILELAEALGISDRAVKKHLRSLTLNGVIRRIGPDKGGHWEVTPR